MNLFQSSIFFLVVFMLSSCEGKKESEQLSSDPCEIIDLAFINKNFSPETEVIHRAGAGRFPSCSYRWEVANAQERKNTYAEQQIKNISEGGSFSERKITPIPRFENEVMITLASKEGFENTEEASRTLKALLTRLQDGVVAEGITFQSNVQYLEGVADEGAWIEAQNQVSFRKNNQIYHLVVNIDDDRSANLEEAKRIISLLFK